MLVIIKPLHMKKRGELVAYNSKNSAEEGEEAKHFVEEEEGGSKGGYGQKEALPPPNNDEGLPLLHNCRNTDSPKNIEPSDGSSRKAETTEKRKTTAENNDVSTNKS
mmetsp:Transcript_29471/g.51224  ORF Transcript_29471/g.51224 Transcript_29471/m.51224 type:complete len:107 (-) Transcript_29471:29-349(-)